MYGGIIIGLAALHLLGWGLSTMDMRRRDERLLAWLVKFLLLGPVAAGWYTLARKPIEGEAPTGTKAYRFARGFLLPWTVYCLACPAIVVTAITLGDLPATPVYERASYLFWSPVLYLMVMVMVLPLVWLVPFVVALAIVLGHDRSAVTMRRGDEAGKVQ